MSGVFEPNNYDPIRAGCQRSADVIVPLILEDRFIESVVDVGCGEGWFARRFAELGVKNVVGIDGHRPPDCPIEFIEADLTQPLPALTAETADLVVCLEVAEHLPESRGPSFVAEICEIAPAVVWSSAIPGQGGHQHINERWLSYWADLFSNHGYMAFLNLRTQIWDDPRVEPWYRQNIVVFYEGVNVDPHVPPMIDVVHPDIFGWRVTESRRV